MAETVLGDFGEEVGIAPRHWDVVQRTDAPFGVDAHGHQKAAPRISDLLERGMHSNLIIAIVFRRNQPLRCVRPDHKRSPRETSATSRRRSALVVSSTGDFQANCSRRCLTVLAASGSFRR